MYITCQQEMDFGKAHNDAMNRGLHKYYFKSLPHVDPEGSHWLREHAMYCILWAQKMAATDSSAALTERVLAGREDGLESEDIQRSLSVSILEDNMPEFSTEGAENSPAREEEDQYSHPQESIGPEFAVFSSSPSAQSHLGKSTQRKGTSKETRRMAVPRETGAADLQGCVQRPCSTATSQP